MQSFTTTLSDYFKKIGVTKSFKETGELIIHNPQWEKDKKIVEQGKDGYRSTYGLLGSMAQRFRNDVIKLLKTERLLL